MVSLSLFISVFSTTNQIMIMITLMITMTTVEKRRRTNFILVSSVLSAPNQIMFTMTITMITMIITMITMTMMEDELRLGELGVVCPKPDVAVGHSHMVPPKSDFHPHLCIFIFCIFLYFKHFLLCIFLFAYFLPTMIFTHTFVFVFFYIL